MVRFTQSKIFWIALLFLSGSYLPVAAFETVDEQIDHYLEIIDRGGNGQKIEMFKRLQWSAISDPRLYDSIEQIVESQYTSDGLNKNEILLLVHAVRALGYSGNDKYLELLKLAKSEGALKKVRSHANKAVRDLELFSLWNTKIRLAEVPVEGKDVETTVYMKMLSVDDPSVYRLGARAIYHQRLNDPDLIGVAAKQLESSYNRPELDKTGQDAVAWLCKAIGQSGNFDYVELLTQVAAGSPYKKVRKHASKYAQ